MPRSKTISEVPRGVARILRERATVTRRDSLRIEAAQGFLGLGMLQDAWDELENIEAKDRGCLAVLKVRLEVTRAMGKWELVETLARHLAKVEPDESLHVFNLAQAMRELEGHESALAVYEFAVDRWPKFAHLCLAMAIELCALDWVPEAKAVLKTAIKLDPQLREVPSTIRGFKRWRDLNDRGIA